MITPAQLTKLQKYAEGKDADITVSFSPRGSVDIKHGDEHWISLANKASSALTMRSVKKHIDKCVERYGQDLG